MIKKLKIVVLVLVFNITTVVAQKIFKADVFDFSIEKPKNWIEANNYLKEKPKKDTTYLKEHKKLMLLSFYKFDVRKHPETIVPTIEVYVIENPTETFLQFEKSVEKTANELGKYVQDYQLLINPTEIEINNQKAVYYVSTHTLTAARIIKFSRRNYQIPYRNYFFQIIFTEEYGKEVDKKLFDDLIKSIKIGK